MQYKNMHYKFMPMLLIAGMFILALVFALQPTSALAQDIGVTKSASPTTLTEPGGLVTYTFDITNTTGITASLTSITDTFTSLPSNLNAAITTNNCGPFPLQMTTTTYSCIFIFNITPITTYFPSGLAVTNEVSVTAVVTDSTGVTVTNQSITDSRSLQTLNVGPDVLVTKQVDANGDGTFSTSETTPEPGGLISYVIVVTNTSPSGTDPITITGLLDTANDSNGVTPSINLLTSGACVPSAPIAPGGVYTCTYTRMIAESAGYTLTNDILVRYEDDEGVSGADKSDQARVSLTDLPPTIALLKTVTPVTMPEPGGLATFTLVITNTSPATTTDPLTITTLTDSIHGNLFNQGTCLTTAGVITIATGGTYSCIFTQIVTGPAGYTETDIITATVTDDDGGPPVSGTSNPATVTITDLPPTIALLKTVTPINITEPGGVATFTFVITNTSPATMTEPVTITTLNDSVHGNLFGQGTCPSASGVITIAAGNIYSCSFTATVSGNAGYTETDVIVADVTDDEGTSATDVSNSATVTITDVLPTIEVIKTANPITITEPGGSVNFTVIISNTSPASTDPITLTALVDSIYGNLITPTLCGTAVVTIASGGAHICTFTQMITGDAGFMETDIITATVTDDEGNSVSDDDLATVTVDDAPPAITLVKTANPTFVTAPGGLVTFTLLIENISVNTDPVTITSLIDSIHGNLDVPCGGAVGTVITATGGIYTCSFTATVTGPGGTIETDIITATVTDDENNVTDASDDATVFIDETVTPTLVLTKTVALLTVNEPGGVVTFSLIISNTSQPTDPITITSLVDSIYGNLSAPADCGPLPLVIPAGSGYGCTFTRTVNGNAGFVETDIITATGTDDEGIPVTDSDDATVTVVNVLPTIEVVKTAGTLTVTELGGVVTFNVVVTNTSPASTDPVTVTNLTDFVTLPLVNLNGVGSCSVPQLLAPGASYACSFTQTVSGNAGDVITDTVTARGVDDEFTLAGDSDDASVTVVDELPSMVLEKTATPNTVPSTGGLVNFTVRITNTSPSATDPITLITLNDNIHGPLNALPGTCSVPQLIPVGGTYLCFFTAMVTGPAGSVEIDTVTAVGRDDEGNNVNANDSATVQIQPNSNIIDVIKNASPVNIPEPGAMVTFTVGIENINPLGNSITITNLVDNVHGNLNGQGDCTIPQVILFGDTYICTFSQFVAGNAGYIEVDTVTADGVDTAGNQANDSDNAIVTVNDVLPVIDLLKSASPTVVPEPGGLVTFTVVVTNNSVTTDPVTVFTMTDSIYGNLNGLGTCITPQIILSGGIYTCRFQATVTGNAGYTETNVILAEGTDDEGNPAQASDDETVTVDGIAPSINVIKNASPSVLFEPGGNVAFTVMVDNTSVSSTDPVTITNMVDDIHGNLNGQGTCALPQLIPVGLSYSCTFTVAVAGDAGFTEIDTITASGTDDDGDPVSGSDDETVSIVDRLPSMVLQKTAVPTTVMEAGGIVTFTVVVTNTSFASTDPIDVMTLTDSIYGDLDGQGSCSTPFTLLVGGIYTCAFTQFITGNVGDIEIDVITADGQDDEGNPVSDSDDAVVIVYDTDSTISLVKTVDADGDGVYTASETMPEPGGTVNYQIVVSNDSPVDDVIINMVNDPILGGNISATCTPALPALLVLGDTITCLVSDVITGNAGDSVTNVASATGVDEDGKDVSASDSANVTFIDVTPALNVIKTANPISITEPGGNVIFTVVVENASVSTDPIEMTSLVDDIHGDLNGQGSCIVPQTLLPGGSYSCTFIVFVSGNAGDSEVDTVTASGTDDEGNPVTSEDTANVSFFNAAPVIEVVKTANPTNVPEPGADVNFTVVVHNQSNTFDPVTVTRLVDNVHGNLNGQGDCLVPFIINPGDSYTCSFTAFVGGNAGSSEVDVITARGRDDDGTPVSDSDDAVVTISDRVPAILLAKTADPLLVAPAGSDVTFTVAITNVGVSTDPVDVITLTDSIYGNLNGQGSCVMPQSLAPGDTYRCEFVVNIGGIVGDTETNVITALGNDDEGNPVADADDAIVTVNSLDPFLAVTKGVDADGDGIYQNSEIIQEPGGPVNYQILVENISLADITITEIDDPTLGGDISASCTPILPVLLSPGDIITCLVSGNIIGDAGDLELNIASATGFNGAGFEMTDFDDATVIIANNAPGLSITKNATPDNVFETGGNVDFVLVINNNSVANDPVNIFTLQDSIYGDLNGQGDCSVPQMILAGESYTCTFSAFVERNAGNSETNIVITAGTDDENNQAMAFTDETVFIDDVLPVINVVKTVDPTNVNEPGDRATFVVKVENNSGRFDPIVLNQLIDDVHGNLNGQGTCILPQMIQNDDDYTCSFTVAILGDAGFTETDTIIATVQDDEGNVVRDSDDATVTVDDVPPVITVNKSANPNAVQEPGGNVVFTVIVTNDSVSTDPVTLTDLVDDIHGDLDGEGTCSMPQTLLSGASYACTFTAFVSGNADDTEVDTVTATANDNEGNSVTGLDTATVAITNAPPILRVSKTPDVDSVSEAGGDVTFTIVVSNDSVSTDPLTLNSLIDSIYNDLNGQGSCAVPQTIASGADYTCSFTINLTRNAGDSEMNIVTATGQDDEGNSVNYSDKATVTIDNIGSQIQVTKQVDANGDGIYSASETILEPGGTVAYRMVIENISAVDDVTLQVVNDPLLGGDISANCMPGLPALMVPGATVTCNVTDNVTGDAGESILNEVTVSGTDDDGNPLSDTADATVIIVDSTSDLSVTKELVSSVEDTPVGPKLLTVTYRLTYINNGPDSAPDVLLTDIIPTGMKVISTSLPYDNIALPSLNWDLGTLQPGKTGVITLVLTIDSAAKGDELANTANIDCSCLDPVRGNNFDSASATVGQNIIPVGDPFAITLEKLGSQEVTDGIEIFWTTSQETNTRGFEIYRSTKDDLSDAENITTEMISSKGSEGYDYSFVDETALSDVNYIYWLFENEFGGVRNSYGPIQLSTDIDVLDIPTYIYLPILRR